jgi:hypothetical protein
VYAAPRVRSTKRGEALGDLSGLDASGLSSLTRKSDAGSTC